MSQRLRHERCDLMQQLDDTRASHRARIESKDGSWAAPVCGALKARTTAARIPPDARVACASCETLNDADARFCKTCGQRLGA